jgi:hypothetical protein
MGNSKHWGWILALACCAGGPALKAQDVPRNRNELETWEAIQSGAGNEVQLDLQTGEEKEDSGWRFGLRLLGASPRQDFRDVDRRTGCGAGLFVENDLHNGWRVQSHADYMSFPRTSSSNTAGFVPNPPPIDPAIAAPLALSADAVEVGFDVDYHLPYRGLKSVYVLAGLSAIRYEVDYTVPSGQVDPATGIATASVAESKYKTPLSLGLDFGLGVDINRTLSVEVRYICASLSGAATQGTVDRTFTTIQAGLEIRF